VNVDTAQSGTAAERLAAAESALESELTRIVTSGEYATWFAKLASFRRYSPTNTLWILPQRPDATRVASYRTWQQVDRQVRKGERGIQIFHPRPFWIDPATGDKVNPPRTETDRARLVRKVSFGIGHVFDISQTDGTPLPSLERPAPAVAPAALLAHLQQHCTDHHIEVVDQALPSELRGYYQRDSDRIVIHVECPPGERAAVLAHELAHRHDPELVRSHTAGQRDYYRHNRGDCEAVAEASAHVVSARFGHDITGHAAGYITSWIDGDLDRFRQLSERVGQVTTQLVPPDRIDQHLTVAQARAADESRNQGRGRSR
jgi:antirestriction protein ArdC